MNLFNKTATALITLTMIGGFTLTGCGTTSSGSASNLTNTSTNTSSSSSSATSTGKVSVKDGVTNLLSMAKNLKTELTSGNDAKVKENGPKLEDTWSSFEDGVKPKYPDLYAKVEQYLDPTVAGSKADPLDKQALLKLDDGLIEVLTELSQKAQ